MSQLLRRIDELLLSETDPQLIAELLAKKACYLARIGRFVDARALIDSIRQTFGDGRSGRVTVSVMLAEGLLLHFEELAPSAYDRVARAQLLSNAMKDRELIALSSAWKAYLEFEASKFESAGRSLRIAFDSVTESDDAAYARCAVVIFNALALCGEQRAAQRWFLIGRDHALKAGDQASIDALLHSRATFGVARLRAKRCREVVDATELSLARAEIESARNLQRLTGVEAHVSYVDLADARLQILESRFESAATLFRSVRNAGPFPIGNFSQGLVDLEIAYCHCMSGRMDEALRVHTTDLATSHGGLDVDDELVAAWMRHEMSGLDSRFGSELEDNRKLKFAMAEHESFVFQVRAVFAQFLDERDSSA